MRNFEKDFDRLIANLKESAEILHNVNEEMDTAVDKTTITGYVVVETKTGMFMPAKTDAVYGDVFVPSLVDAKIFTPTQGGHSIAEDWADYYNKKYDSEKEFAFVVAPVKVVK